MPAAGELLELDQGEIGLDAGGVAVHHEADGAGGRDHRRLGVAVAVLLAELHGPVPRALRGLAERLVGQVGVVQRHRLDVEVFEFPRLATGRRAVVAHHPEHGVAVVVERGKGAALAGHLRRGCVGGARHERADGAAKRPARLAVVGEPERHEKPAEIGEPQPQRAVLIGAERDLARGELRHHHRDLEHDGPQLDRVLEALDVEAAVLAPEGDQVERGEVARRVVEEHVLGAGIRRVDAPPCRAGVPGVDGAVELDAGVGRSPGRLRDLVPEPAGVDGLRHLAIGAADQVPGAAGLDLPQEGVGHADRVVGVLARDGEIGLGLPVGVVDAEVDLGEALLGPADRAVDAGLGHQRLPRLANRVAERRVGLGLEAIGAAARVAGIDDGVEAGVQQLRTAHQRRDLLLLHHLPGDEVLDVGVVDIDDDHLGGAPGGAARLDGAGGAIADLEEAHQARGLAPARERFALAAQVGEVGARARAVLEEPRLAHPEVHDPAVVDEVVLDALDEAGVRLGVLVGRLGLFQIAALVVDVVVTLGRAVDAVGPMQPGVEPLRRVGRGHLERQHGDELVVEGAGVRFSIEVAGLPAPVGPGAGEAVEDLLGRALTAGGALVVGAGSLRVRLAAP